jgi:hypothetical protein
MSPWRETLNTAGLFLIAGIAFVVGLWLVGDRVVFLAAAERTVGEVTQLESRNGRCGGRRTRRSCTKFYADVSYRTGGATWVLEVTAGRSNGYGRPLAEADYRVGDRVTIAYNPRRPRQAYRDTLWDIWGAPLMAFFVQIGAMFGGLNDRKR